MGNLLGGGGEGNMLDLEIEGGYVLAIAIGSWMLGQKIQ